MLIWRKMLGQKMEDESGYLHRQLACKVSSFGETGNNPYTYNCDALYMASPLEKNRELASVNFHTEYMDIFPVVFYGSCWTSSSYWGGCQGGEGQKVRKVRNRGEGVQIRVSLNRANRRQRQMVDTVIGLHEPWRSGHGPRPPTFSWLSCDLILGRILLKCLWFQSLWTHTHTSVMKSFCLCL